MLINLHFLIEYSREIWAEFSQTCGESLIVCYSLFKGCRSKSYQKCFALSKILSFKAMDKQLRFTRDVLLYSGLIIQKRICLARFSDSKSHSSQQIRLASAEFRGGIKCDRHKGAAFRKAELADDSD
jgi:hypothetical protein